MAGGRVPAALRDRLGDEATFGLIELLDAERKEWREQVLSVAADRFERRLTEELSGLRVEFRTVLHDGLAAVRTEMHDGVNSHRDAEVVVSLLGWADRRNRGATRGYAQDYRALTRSAPA
jgi:hypothetical protein